MTTELYAAAIEQLSHYRGSHMCKTFTS
jgi:hypothetical protein